MGDNFSDNLNEARLAANLTQREVAEKIGVAKSTYSQYESGNREPMIATIKKLAKLLNVSADELLGLPVNADEMELRRPAIKTLVRSAKGNDDIDIEMAAQQLRRLKLYHDMIAEAQNVHPDTEKR